MISRPALTTLDIKTSENGFYAGFNKKVAVSSKLLIAALVIWAAIFPLQASGVLNNLMSSMLDRFGVWYMYAMVFYGVTCIGLASIPSIGSIVLGKPEERPEFSRFSWYAMMFGAGIGVGMLTYGTAEPINHFVTSPDTILGHVQSESAENVSHAIKWGIFHWGISAWGCYALGALALAFFSFNRGLPLTTRSALSPLFGRKLEGTLGHIVDITAVIATLVGISVTIGIGAGQFAAGLYEITGINWLVGSDNLPTNLAKIIALTLIMFISIWTAVSGVGRGIKWFSNINLILSFVLLSFYIIFGPTSLALESLFASMKTYLFNLPSLATTYWGSAEDAQGAALYQWQTVNWTIFIWAWWIGFAPFVGLFLARISRGRTIREFVFGAMLIPPLMTCIWFTLAGSAAIDLELNGDAARTIINAGTEFQLYATIKLLVSKNIAMTVITLVVVPLLLTFLVTSANSAILVITTISSAGSPNHQCGFHIIIWGIALSLIIIILLLAGGMNAIQAALIIGALPFSLILALTGISLATALIGDSIRRYKNIPISADANH